MVSADPPDPEDELARTARELGWEPALSDLVRSWMGGDEAGALPARTWTGSTLDPDLVAHAVEPPSLPPEFECLALLGRGGMGEVWRVQNRALRRLEAMKILLPGMATHAGLVARFVEEAQATAQLAHPGIVPIHRIGRLPDGRLFYTMKEVVGRTLRAVMAEARAAGSTADLIGLVDLVRASADAVGYAHVRGVLHRDLKPENVLVGEHGEVLVVDWGLVKILAGGVEPSPVITDRSLSEALHTQAGRISGTLGYMAPEQRRGEQHLGPGVDVFALGVILYECLTRERPAPQFLAPDNLRAALREGQPWSAPQALQDLILRALCRDPADRFPDARALSAGLREWLVGARTASRRDALAEATDALFSALGPAEQALARALVLRMLDATGHPRERARARLERLGEGAGPLLDRLVASGTLEARGEHLQLADPALLEQARWLEAWLAEARPVLPLAARFEAAAAEWAALSRPRARLWGGVDLQELSAWELRARPTWDPEEQAFAEASRAEVRARARRAGWLRVGAVAVVVGIAAVTTGLWRQAVESRQAEAEARQAAEVRALAAEAGRREQEGALGGAVALWEAAEALRPDPMRAGHLDLLRSASASFGRIEDLQPPVRDAAWSPQGDRVAVVGGEGVVHVHDARTGALQLTLSTKGDGGSAGPMRVWWSEDGALLAATDLGGTLTTWDGVTGERLARIEGDQGWRPAARFLPHGTSLVAPLEGGSIRLVDGRSGETTGELAGHSRFVFDLAFANDGQTLLSASVDQSVRIWDLPTGSLRNQLDHPVQLLTLASTPDARRVATVGVDDLRTWLWDGQTGRLVATLLGHEDRVSNGLMSADGAWWATVSEDRTARIWRTEDGALQSILSGMPGEPVGLAFRPDGAVVAVGDTAGAITLWKPSTGRRVEVLQGSAARLSALAWDPDGRRLLTGDMEGAISIWTPRSASALPLDPCGGRGRLPIAVGPDTAQLAVGLTDGGLCYLPPEGGSPKRLSDVGAISWARFTPDGHQLVLGPAQQEGLGPRVWSLDGSAVRPLSLGEAHAGAAVSSAGAVWTRSGHELVQADLGTGLSGRSLALDRAPMVVSFAGDTALVAYQDHGAAALSLPDGHPWAERAPVPEYLYPLAISPEGDWVAWATTASALEILHRDGRRFAVEAGAPVSAIVASRDRLAALLGDRRIALWTAEGSLLGVVPNETANGRIFIDPEGDWVGLVDDAGGVRIWRGADLRPWLHLPVREDGRATDAVPLAGGRLVVLGRAGGLWSWGLSGQGPSRSNLRVCRESGAVVALLPFEEAGGPWAPRERCGTDGKGG